MLRFFVPENTNSASERAEAINIQIKDFLHMEAFSDLLKILEVDIDSLGAIYNGRLKENGSVVETQKLKPLESLEKNREDLYPLFRELGFIDINKPRKDKNSHIIILGGSLSACFERTKYAQKMLDETTRFVDAFTCYRPVAGVERNASVDFCPDTEFGAMSESFVSVFDLNRSEYSEKFKSDRNLNRISCIRNYEKTGDRTFRIFVAPSSEPAVRRADTGDTFRFYMETEAENGPDDSLLFITNNRYCNRQFLQLAYQMIEFEYPGTIDVIGCFPDDRVTSVERYDPFQYLQDLIGIIDWADRFDKLV